MIDLMNFAEEIKDGRKNSFICFESLVEQKLRINGERERLRITRHMPWPPQLH